MGEIARVAPAREGAGWRAEIAPEGAPSQAEREELIRHFTSWALAEHASIASFARFSLQLLALGAPSDLVARAAQAMTDEVRHAQLGFGLVEALSGAPFGPGPLCIDGAIPAETSLQEVLRLTVREGVIGETLAALEARMSMEETTIPAMRDMLTEVAEDESRHAELAYAFAAWAVHREPALARLIQEEIEQWEPSPVSAISGLGRWGILDSAARQQIHRDGFEQVIRPLVAQLSLVGSQACL